MARLTTDEEVYDPFTFPEQDGVGEQDSEEGDLTRREYREATKGEGKGQKYTDQSYPPVYKGPGYKDWRRKTEFWIAGAGNNLDPTVIGPRMMVQIRGGAAKLVKKLKVNDVNIAGGHEVIFVTLEKAPVVKELDDQKIDKNRKAFQELERQAGENMEFFLTRATNTQSDMQDEDEGAGNMYVSEEYFVRHVLDAAQITKRDRALVIAACAGKYTMHDTLPALRRLAPLLDPVTKLKRYTIDF